MKDLTCIVSSGMRLAIFTIVFCLIAIITRAQNPPGGTCCCGSPQEFVAPGLDFEFSPTPPPNSFFTYAAGQTFGPWTVTRETIDHVGGMFAGLGNGNPNGPSAFVDLHGSPGFGAISYLLTGLIPGTEYIIEFWTAHNGGGIISTGTLRIAGGVWLNESWQVNVSGATLWRKETYKFTAAAASADMEFSSTGPVNYQGVLVDDIRIFYCPLDEEKPTFLNPPMDLSLDCLSELPAPDVPLVNDNCDPDPAVDFNETFIEYGSCHRVYTRSWTVTDVCDNSTSVSQTITIQDDEAPVFTRLPEDFIGYCIDDPVRELDLYLARFGNAQATDNCLLNGIFYNYDRDPEEGCDSIVIYFEAQDDCGNFSLAQANFILRDTSKPQITQPALNVDLQCHPSPKDSLRKWLLNNGYALASDSCGALQWHHNFDGDSARREITVTFFAQDLCGNIDSTIGVFKKTTRNDTILRVKPICGLSVDQYDTVHYQGALCDSVVITHRQHRPRDTILLQNLVCQLNMTGFDTTILANRFLCDSIIIVQNIFKKPDTTLLLDESCSHQQNWNDTLVLQGILCDSTVIVQHIALRKDSVHISTSTCDSSAAGIFYHHHTNLLGCDSVVIESRAFQKAIIDFRQLTSCGSKNSRTDTTIYSTQLCDSIVIRQYIPGRIDSIYLTDNTCNPSDTGLSVLILENADKCDSIVFTYNILRLDTTMLFDKSCNRQDTGLFINSFPNRYGCDSIVMSRIDLKTKDTTITDSLICDQSLLGSDTLFFSNSDHCDSLSIIHYRLKNQFFEPRFIDITCHNAMDGRILIDSISGFAHPFTWVVNNINYTTGLNELSNLSPGTYRFHIVDKDSCISSEFSFRFNNPQKINVDLGQDRSVRKNEVVRIQLNPDFIPSSVIWRPHRCPNCQTIDFTMRNEHWVFAEATDSSGCIVRDSVFLRLIAEGDIYFPNVFSPNQDGINDRFWPAVIPDNTELVELHIFNRWGEQVYSYLTPESQGIKEGWDGKYQGKLAPADVYVFYAIFDSPSGTIKKTGDLTLMR